jgi:hypothetical protein
MNFRYGTNAIRGPRQSRLLFVVKALLWTVLLVLAEQYGLVNK